MTIANNSAEEIGTAGGLVGAIRAFGSVLAVAVFSTTLSSRLQTTIPQYVVSAAEKAGLRSSIPALVKGLGGTFALNSTNVPGLTSQITEVASAAYRYANSEAYKTVFFLSFAFGGLGMILCWFVANNDHSKDGFVAGHIHEKEEKDLELQTGYLAGFQPMEPHSGGRAIEMLTSLI